MRCASYPYLIYITCLKYAFLFNIHVYSASENLFHAVHKGYRASARKVYERGEEEWKNNQTLSDESFKRA